MLTSRKCKKLLYVLFWVGCASFLLVFYCISNPLILLSPDDWLYSGYSRIAISIPTERLWNPSRIFPEIVMPFIADIGVYVIYPLCKDYMCALSTSYGIFVSAVVLVYFYSFSKVISSYTKSVTIKIVVVLFFIILNFGLFTNSAGNAPCILLAGAPNLFFYYSVPMVLNFSLCFFIISNGRGILKIGKRRSPFEWIKFGGAWLILYLCVFSNLFVSIILATFSALVIASDILQKRREGIRNSLRYNLEYIVIIILWLYALFCDWMGGRASSILNSTEEVAMLSKVKETIVYSMGWIEKCNLIILIFTIMIAIVGFHRVK